MMGYVTKVETYSWLGLPVPVIGRRAKPVDVGCGRWPEQPGASLSVTRAR